MATRTRKQASPDYDTSRRLSRRRYAAIVAQFGGFLTTLAFIQSLGIEPVTGFVIALILEWLLFEFKRALLSGERDLLGVLALIADTVLNAGGIWGLVLQLDATESYKMFSQSLQTGEEMRFVPALVIALALGAALAIAPHKLWHMRAEEQEA